MSDENRRCGDVEAEYRVGRFDIYLLTLGLGSQISYAMEGVLHHLIVGRVVALVKLSDQRVEAARRLICFATEPCVKLFLIVCLEFSYLGIRGLFCFDCGNEENRQ